MTALNLNTVQAYIDEAREQAKLARQLDPLVDADAEHALRIYAVGSGGPAVGTPARVYSRGQWRAGIIVKRGRKLATVAYVTRGGLDTSWRLYRREIQRPTEFYPEQAKRIAAVATDAERLERMLDHIAREHARRLVADDAALGPYVWAKITRKAGEFNELDGVMAIDPKRTHPRAHARRVARRVGRPMTARAPAWRGHPISPRNRDRLRRVRASLENAHARRDALVAEMVNENGASTRAVAEHVGLSAEHVRRIANAERDAR